MSVLDLGRWQFGITTVYHFIMVPLTIGLGLIVALMQTMWYRTRDEKYLRMTKFWGKLYLINFIMGVATGIVQEFQFGMAWSEYSRFVGDVFGAPLALEALIAFFAESTFLGLWIFGWDRLKPGVHLATIWLAASGAAVSAYFIIVANSWMQHPVGVEMNGNRPRMNDIVAVLTNNTAISATAHTLMGTLAVVGSFLVGISWYHLGRRRSGGLDTVKNGRAVIGDGPAGRDRIDHSVWLTSLRWGAVIGVVAFLALTVTGDRQAKLMYKQQPLKMAAAEASCTTGSDFSILTLSNPGSNDCAHVNPVITIPGLLGFLANGNWNEDVQGVQALLPQYQEKFGTNLPDDPRYPGMGGQKIEYVPLMIVTYWGFRLMIGFGMLGALVCALAWWVSRKRRTVPGNPLLRTLAILGIVVPFLGNICGWVFTEMGRQPFVVAPNPDGNEAIHMFTAAAISPGVSAGEIGFSLVALTLIYAALLVVEIRLIVTYVRAGVPSAMPELLQTDEKSTAGDDDVLAFAY